MSYTYDVDVIQMSDFRLPGGTTSSIAEEVRAQSDAGLSTAMIHIAGSVTNYPLGWSAHIRRIIGLPGVSIRTPKAPLRAKVLVVRHPTVLYSTRTSLKNIHADHIVVVANHAAVDAAGTHHYDVAATDAKVSEIFGKAPIWAPIGPVVRGTILQQNQTVPLRATDWFNIFNFPSAFKERTGFVEKRPVIGRHSRPQRGKWPDTGQDILAAYPDSPDLQVRILGGAQIAQKLLGYLPQSWEVVPFGGEDPADFLTRIDFWVYMHHPDLREAFGRAAMESLAAGCVAIMPPYMEELFGDAALYSAPSQVKELIDEYSADKDKFLRQSRSAQNFARRFSSKMHVDRLADLGVVAQGTGEFTFADDTAAFRPNGLEFHGTTLVIIAGEQTALALAAYADADGSAQKFTWMTIGEHIVPELDSGESLFVSSALRMNMSETVWNEYFAHRLAFQLSLYSPHRVVYSGALPPGSILNLLAGMPVEKLWIQQPLQNPEAQEQAIRVAQDFHSVLPPCASDEELRTALLGGFE